MPDVIELEILLPPQLTLRMVQPPAELPADMAAVIVGKPGATGGVTTVTVGPSPLSGHTAVACNAAGRLVYADCANPAHQLAVLGLIADAYSAGAEAEVQTGYVLSHVGWSWSPGPVFVGEGGQLVQALPSGAVFSQVVGLALSSTRVLVDVQPPISLA